MYDRLRGQFPSLKDCQHIAAFIKLESYPEFKEARWINSRVDEFKVFSGPFFKAIEEELYKNPWFIKHTPVPERPKIINGLYKAGLRYYENDFKAFESHFTAEFMAAAELQLYSHALQKYPRESDFICKVISGTNKLRTRAGIKFEIDARRMSGDMCTSLGNGFSNLMLILFIVAEKHGSVSGLVEGDDGLFATDVEITSEDYANLGFTVEINEVSHPSDAHFCGCTCSEEGHVIKNPRRVFQTFGWTHSCVHAGNSIMDQLLRSKALSLCYELPQCPILGLLGRVALQITEGLTARREDQTWQPYPEDYAGPTGVFNPSAESRLKMERLYNISIPTQILAEKAITDHDMVLLSQLIPPNRDNLDYCARYIEVG